MSRYWRFDENRCTFERTTLAGAARAFAAVRRDDDGELWARIGQWSRRWPDGDHLTVAGVRFARELFAR